MEDAVVVILRGHFVFVETAGVDHRHDVILTVFDEDATVFVGGHLVDQLVVHDVAPSLSVSGTVAVPPLTIFFVHVHPEFAVDALLFAVGFIEADDCVVHSVGSSACEPSEQKPDQEENDEEDRHGRSPSGCRCFR